MQKYRIIFLTILLYISLIFGFIYNENLNYGSYSDWIGVNIHPIIDFSNNFLDTLVNYEKYSHRHSPIYLIFLSLILKSGVEIEYLRLIHLHLSLFLIFLFFKCLEFRFSNIDKNILALLSLVIFLSPTFRSLVIWPDSRVPGLIFFTLSIFYFLNFEQTYKIKYAWLCSVSLIISSYISPNFSIFSVYFYYFFFKKINMTNFIYLLFANLLFSVPMFYYLFILDVNFFTAGGEYSEGKNLYEFNLSDKILIISTIFLFHFIPFLNSLLNFKDLKNFVSQRFIFIFIFLILLIFFFDYGTQFTGGGFFFQLSLFLFDNNYFFYFVSFFSIILISYISKISYSNFLLITLLILSNIQNSIYHKYYEPMILILIFTLLKNFEFKNFFKKISNIYILYLFSLGFIIIRVINNNYLI